MLWSSFLLLLVIAHFALIATVMAGASPLPDWLSPPTGLVSTILFALVAISSERVQTVADNGDIVTTSEPVIGIYAFGLAVIAFLLTLVLTIEWLPTNGLTGGRSSGF